MANTFHHKCQDVALYVMLFNMTHWVQSAVCVWKRLDKSDSVLNYEILVSGDWTICGVRTNTGNYLRVGQKLKGQSEL